MDQDSEYLTWHAPDGSLTIRVSHFVIHRMNIEIMRGFGVTRRRGTEAGGILCGTFETNPACIVIDDFEPIPCEYAYGPSYVLSPADNDRFAEVVAQPDSRVIGYFRSHTREGLTIDQNDVALFDRFLADTGRVALIVKPFATRDSSASYFFPQNGHLQPGTPPLEFTFSTKVQEARPQPPSVPEPEAASATAVAVAAAPAPAPVDVQERQRLLTRVLGWKHAAPAEGEVPTGGVPATEKSPRRVDVPTVLLTLLFAAAAATLGFVVGYQQAGGRIKLSPKLALAAPADQSPFNLVVRVQTAGDRIQVSWDPESLAVQRATSGVLYIVENGTSTLQPLDLEELRTGRILHLPSSGQVTFRLELGLSGGSTVSESVSWKRPGS